MLKSYPFQGNTYQEAEDYLGGKDERPAAYKCRLFRSYDGSIALRMHNTVIVRYFRNGTMQLTNGLWFTVTTLRNMNRFSKALIVQRKHVWYVLPPYEHSPNRWDHRIPYYNGMIIKEDGNVYN